MPISPVKLHPNSMSGRLEALFIELDKALRVSELKPNGVMVKVPNTYLPDTEEVREAIREAYLSAGWLTAVVDFEMQITVPMVRLKLTANNPD